jgi:hypothetical protein
MQVRIRQKARAQFNKNIFHVQALIPLTNVSYLAETALLGEQHSNYPIPLAFQDAGLC